MSQNTIYEQSKSSTKQFMHMEIHNVALAHMQTYTKPSLFLNLYLLGMLDMDLLFNICDTHIGSKRAMRHPFAARPRRDFLQHFVNLFQ